MSLGVHVFGVCSSGVDLVKFPFSSFRDTERNKDLAFLEAQIYEYVEVLGVRILSLSFWLQTCPAVTRRSFCCYPASP